MDEAQIPGLGTAGVTNPEQLALREHAPKLLALCIGSLITEDVLTTDNPDVKGLKGGVNSACYLVEGIDGSVVVKLRPHGASTEAEWLLAFARSGARAVPVLSTGVVPQAQESSVVKYVALGAITNHDGSLAPNGRDINPTPELIRVVSYQAGQELARIHRDVTDKPFGIHEDGVDHPKYDTWINYITTNHLTDEALASLDLSPDDVQGLRNAYTAIDFPTQGVRAHGDFGLHNLLVRTTEEAVEVYIIDPNPIVADPYYDLANQANIRDIRVATESYHSPIENLPWMAKDFTDYDQLVRGYEEVLGQPIDHNRLVANQLVKLLSLIKERESRDPAVMTKQEWGDNVRDIRIRRGLAINAVKELLAFSKSQVVNDRAV